MYVHTHIHVCTCTHRYMSSQCAILEAIILANVTLCRGFAESSEDPRIYQQIKPFLCVTFTYKQVHYFHQSQINQRISLERDYTNKQEMFVCHTCSLAHPGGLSHRGDSGIVLCDRDAGCFPQRRKRLRFLLALLGCAYQCG